ncbi:MAG: hypothetical protein RTU92_01350 [Candidatus Thorarchaeota archaeon]
MSLERDELSLLACLYRKKVIGRSHRRVDSIAGLCHVRDKKGFKKMLKRLAIDGYLIQHHGPAYSLSRLGVRVVVEFLSSE